MTPLTDEQKKKAIMIATGSAFVAFTLGFILSTVLSNKRIDKLEAKIFQLEGWQ